MKTYAETYVQCPHCHLNMIYTKHPENGVQYMECDFDKCVGYGRQYQAKMIEVELTEVHNNALQKTAPAPNGGC